MTDFTPEELPDFAQRYAELHHDLDAALAERNILQGQLDDCSEVAADRFGDKAVLIGIANTLLEIRTLLEHMNSAEGTGSVSSVQIEDWPTKDRPVRVTSKQYAGSPLPVDEALEEHGRLHREAEAKAMDGWVKTAEMVQRNGGL